MCLKISPSGISQAIFDKDKQKNPQSQPLDGKNRVFFRTFAAVSDEAGKYAIFQSNPPNI